MYTFLRLDIYSDIRSGIHSDIFSGILSGIMKILPANSEGCWRFIFDMSFGVSWVCHFVCRFLIRRGRLDPEPTQKVQNVILCNLFVLSFVMFVVFL